MNGVSLQSNFKGFYIDVVNGLVYLESFMHPYIYVKGDFNVGLWHFRISGCQCTSAFPLNYYRYAIMHYSVFQTFRQATYSKGVQNTSWEYTYCVGLLCIVPPQGCEAILIEILQPKRSAAGPHFTRCCLIKKDTYSRNIYPIEIIPLLHLCQVICV